MVSAQGRNLALAIAMGLAFGTLASLVLVDNVPLTLILLQDNSLVRAGAYWQLFTSLLVAPPVPLGLEDVLFNAFAVLWLDRVLSGAFDPLEYYATFVLSGLAGNVASLFVVPLLSFGASGGIFGLLAGALSENFVVERKVDYGLLLWFVFVFVFSSFLFAYVNWLAHLGGTLFGVVAGYYIGVRKRGQTPW